MARVNIKQFIFASLTTLSVFLLIICLIIMLFFKNDPVILTKLESQTKVADKIKIKATPNISTDTCLIYLELETYEFPEMLNVDLTKFSIVKISNLLIDKVDWVEESSSKYTLKGSLNIQLADALVKHDTITMELFLSESTSFNWTY